MKDFFSDEEKSRELITLNMVDSLSEEEGWGLFELSGEYAGRYEIQRIDELKKFESDEDAWLHVVECAETEAPIYRWVLQFLMRNNPPHHEEIMETWRRVHGSDTE